MTSRPFLPMVLPGLSGGSVREAVGRGRFSTNAPFFPVATQRLPTDSLGTMTLRLTNVVAGSTYDVEAVGTGAKVLAGVAESSLLVLAIPYYANTGTNNEMRLKIRKASEAPYYQSYETQFTAGPGVQSIFINQLSDE